MEIRLPKLKSKSVRLAAGFISVAASLFIALGQAPAFAGNQTDQDILKLEDKFFHTTYPKEPMDARLDRLEKMVFGEAKAGNEADRLTTLLGAVPNLDNPGDVDQTPRTASSSRSVSPGQQRTQPAGRGDDADEDDTETPAPIGQYPAVSAIERKVMGKEFAQEPVGQRLARLETKVFGKPSTISDLTERTDRLKEKTGIDISRQVPVNSDWADEDDDDDIFPTPPRSVAKAGEDGKSFSGHDHRQSMRNAFGMTNSSPRPSYGGNSASGMYGAGGYGSRAQSSGSGMYGGGSFGSGLFGRGGTASRSGAGTFADDDEDDFEASDRAMPPAAPDRRMAMRPPQAPPATGIPGLGLNQKVALMEQEVFGKTYKEPILERIDRLEKTLFPQERIQSDRALPDRVERLSKVIQISPTGRSPQVAQRSRSMDDFDDDDLSTAGRNTGQPRGGSGLGKIINSIGNLLTGGFVGGYPMQSAGVITDPRTGLLFDTMTGNLIDPATGMVVGQRAVRGYGTGLGGFNSFNNGFAPYGYGSGMRYGAPGFGMGMGGMRFGTGGFGMGGMWP